MAAQIRIDRYSIAADLDHDGDEDLVTGPQWHENRQGSWGPSHPYATQGHVSGPIAAGDLDGDGDLDLIANVTIGDHSELAWYENRDGRGRFGPAQTIAPGVFWNLAVGDIDGDGHLDAVAQRRDGVDNLVVVRNEAAGAFSVTGQSLSRYMEWVKLIDIDRDGQLDLVTPDGWLRRDTDAQRFVPPAEPLVDGRILDVGDYDGDGWMDIAASSLAGSPHFLMGTPVWNEFETGPAEPEYLDEFSVVDVIVDDFDRDGEFDVLLQFKDTSADARFTVSLYRQVEGVFSEEIEVAPYRYWESARGLIAIDIDGDSYTDVVHDRIQRRFNAAENQFASPLSLSPPTSDNFAADTSDVDGDGDQDLITYDNATGCFFEWVEECRLDFYLRPYVEEQRTFSQERVLIASSPIDGELHFAQFVDLDEDGDDDLVYDVYNMLNDDFTTFWAERTDGAGMFANSVKIGTDRRALEAVFDFDGDGKLDLIRSTPDNGIRPRELLVQRGGENIGEAVPIISLDEKFVAYQWFDWNDDSHLDLIAARRGAQRELHVVWFENTGGRGILAPEQTIFVDVNANAGFGDRLSVVDLRGDSSPEIAYVRIRESVAVYEQNGDGDWQASVRVEAPVVEVQFADFDQDGDQDFFAALVGGEKRTYWNEGDGSFWGQPMARVPTSTWLPPIITDVDGDQDSDLIFSAISSGMLWLENRPLGDVNDDGVFDSTDLIAVMQLGLYEDDIPKNARFQDGDWDGDGDFTAADLVFAFQHGRYAAEGP